MYPDKICDQVSDAILDACIKDDENSRVACGEFMNLRALVLCVSLVTYQAMHQMIPAAQRCLSKCCGPWSS